MKQINFLIIIVLCILTSQTQAQDGYSYSITDNGAFSYTVSAVPNVSTSNFTPSIQSYGFTIIVPDGVTMSISSSLGNGASSTFFDGTAVAMPTIDGYLITETLGSPAIFPAPSTATNTSLLTFQVNGTPTVGSMYILANNSALATTVTPLKSFMQADMIDNGTSAYTNVVDPNSSGLTAPFLVSFSGGINYNAPSYCSNGIDPTPTISGTTGGIFSSSAGLLINMTTGEIDVSASTPGMYTVNYSADGGSSTSITIINQDDPSFSYNAVTYCVDDTDPTPTVTGSTGGIFSSGAGLTINVSTGELDVSASTPGTYSITYTTIGTCPNSSSTNVTVDICQGSECTNAISLAPIPCGSSINVSGSTTGGTPTTASACVTSLGSGGANWYTFTGDGGTYIASTVNSGTNYDTKLWVYEGLCNALNCVTGNDDLIGFGVQSQVSFGTTLGTEYFVVVGGFTSNEGNYEMTITNVIDDASFGYSTDVYCKNVTDPIPTITGSTGGTFSSGPGLSINSSSGVIDVSVSAPGAYTVTYSTNGICPDSSSASITINSLDDPSFSYDSSSYCIGATDPFPVITGLSGGSFSSSIGLAINTTSGLIDLSDSTPGNYSVSYLTAGICPRSSSVSVTVKALDDASFSYDAASYCADETDPVPTITGLSGGSFSGGVGLALNGGTGAIGVTASTPGTYTITYTTAGICPNTSSVSVTVNAVNDASFNYNAAAFCIEDIDPIPTITGETGGTFSALPVGLVINSSTGSIDVSASTTGTYSITYSTIGNCANSSSVNVSLNACQGDECTSAISIGPIVSCGDSLTVSGSTIGGTPYSAQTCGTNIGSGGANWYTLTGDGATYIANTDNPGTNYDTKLWVYQGLCNALVCVNGNDDISPGNLQSEVSFTTTIGTEYLIVVGGFSANEGNYELSVTKNINDASFNYGAGTYCKNTTDPSPLITGSTGGTFSSGAGLIINSNSGTIDVSVSTPGTYTVTYTINGTCQDSSNVSVTINELDDPSFSFSSSSYCLDETDPIPTISGLIGGTFSSSNGLVINTNSGEIDLSASTPGNYSVSYLTAGVCSRSSSVSVTVKTIDDASFNYDSASYCSDSSDPTPTITGANGGTFSSGAGLIINTSTGELDVSASTPGTYTVNYTTSGSCSNSSSNTIEVISIHNSVSQAGGVLSANQAGVTYQWYECPNTLLSGEINQNFTPVTSGDYKVLITSGSCVVESACVTVFTLGMDSYETNSEFSMYPNPSRDYIKIKSSISDDFKIVNLLGQTVKVFNLKANVETTVSIGNLSEGMYLVIAKNNPILLSKKLIIKK